MTLEETGQIVAITATVVGGIDFAIRWLFAKYRDEAVRELSEKVTSLEIENAHLRLGRSQSDNKLAIISTAKDEAEQQLATTEGTVAELTKRVSDRDSRIAELHQHREELTTGQKQHDKRIQRALRLEGTIWTQEPMAGCPKFRSLAANERKTPIVSVLNLKGGVGKTTTTAYLGWTLSNMGYRVLLVDLDLQGSLSSLFIHQEELARLADEDDKLLRGFLAKATTTRATKLLDYAIPSRFLNKDSRIVATTDRLAYAELNLTVQWLLRIGGKGQWSGSHDRRMVLRRALHAKGLTKKFDIILLDCPPLVNMCCSNALAASDYVLTPVTPSEKVIERVSPLLARILEVRASGVNPSLGMLGVVRNGTSERSSAREEDLFLTFGDKCLDVFKQPVNLFDARIPHRIQIQASVNGFVEPDEALAETYRNFAKEFLSFIPPGCVSEPSKARRSRVEEVS